MFLLELLMAFMIFGFIAFVLAILSIPFLLAAVIVVAAVKLALFVILLPFRVLGWAFSLAVR
jgi:hypothetical protein